MMSLNCKTLKLSFGESLPASHHVCLDPAISGSEESCDGKPKRLCPCKYRSMSKFCSPVYTLIVMAILFSQTRLALCNVLCDLLPSKVKQSTEKLTFVCEVILIKECEVCPHEAVVCGPQSWSEEHFIHIPSLTLLLHMQMSISVQSSNSCSH